MTTDIAHPGFLRRHRNLLTGLLLAIGAWLMYLPSTQYGYVYYDDVRILKDHPELYGQPTLAADLKAIFVTAFPREEPLLARDVSWALDGRVFGFDHPFGYHLGNVLLHGVVVALLFAFLLGTTGRFGFALAVAAAFLLLAVHVEPVAWIMGRKDVLSALFLLLSLVAQTRRLDAKNSAAQAGWYAATLIFFLAGLLSKISALTFPAVLFLHAVLLPHLRGERPPGAALPFSRPLFREIALLLPALVITGINYVWYQRTLSQMGIFDRGYTAHGLAHLWNLLMVNPLVFGVYLRQIFFPAHLALLYAWPQLSPVFPPWQIITGLLTVAGALGVGLWMFCRRKDLFFYYAAFWALMIPYLNFIFMGIWVADRYVYFSSFCVLAVAITVAETLWLRPQKAARLGVAVAGAVFVVSNFTQVLGYEPAWRNAETLWQNHLALPRHTPGAYENLAAYYYADFGDAFAHQDQTRMAAALHKMSVVVAAGLGEYWPDQRQSPPASVYYLLFLRSLIEEVQGQPEAALASLLLADQLHPRFDSTNLNLSRLYHQLALAATDATQQATYLHAARDRFANYVQLVYRGRQPPPETAAEMAGLESECAALDNPTLKTQPQKN